MHRADMPKKTKPKRRGSPTVQVRTPKLLHRKLRALAKLYKAPLPEFCRALFASAVDVDKAREFQSRLNIGMMEYRQRDLPLEDVISKAPSKK
jgi:hypothetical protein